MRQTTPLFGFLAAAMLTTAPAWAGKWSAVERVPGRTAITLTIQGKHRSYFQVTEATPLTLAVDGPCRLRVLSRAELPPGADSTVVYQIRITDEGKILRESVAERAATRSVQLPRGGALLSKAHNLVVDLPAGAHRITVSTSGAPSVFVRPFRSAAGHRAADMVSITPVDAARSVTLAEGEKLIPYFSVLPGKPVKLRIVGPTSLNLTTRLDFDATMRGTQSYRIVIRIDGKRVREATFRTTKSAAAAYVDLKDRTASKPNRVTIPIPDGVHEVEVGLAEPKGGTAEIHARIPQPAWGNKG